MSKFWSNGERGEGGEDEDEDTPSQPPTPPYLPPPANDDDDSNREALGIYSTYQTPTLSRQRHPTNRWDPNAAWEEISETQTFLDPAWSTNQKPSDCIRIVCMSDTHGKHREVHLPPGDVLVHGGDFTKTGECGTISDLSAYFQASGFGKVICIAGNHDMTLQPLFYEKNWKRFHKQPFDCTQARENLNHCTYLEDASYEYTHNTGSESGRNDILFYGSPWTPVFFDWAFNRERGDNIRAQWDKIPVATDVLITHGPPLGRGDETEHSGRAGCYELLDTVQAFVKPRVHIFGHIHEDAGATFDGQTLFVNASNVDITYRNVNYPIVIDLPYDTTKPAMLVPPECTMTLESFHEWAETNGYSKFAELLKNYSGRNLPSGNHLMKPEAFDQICAELLIRDKETAHDVRQALAKLYSQSFPAVM